VAIELAIVMSHQFQGEFVSPWLSPVGSLCQNRKFLVEFHWKVFPDFVYMPTHDKGIIKDPLCRSGDALFQVGRFRQCLVDLIDHPLTFVEMS